jgi:hypothetical protein
MSVRELALELVRTIRFVSELRLTTVSVYAVVIMCAS